MLIFQYDFQPIPAKQTSKSGMVIDQATTLGKLAEISDNYAGSKFGGAARMMHDTVAKFFNKYSKERKRDGSFNLSGKQVAELKKDMQKTLDSKPLGLSKKEKAEFKQAFTEIIFGMEREGFIRAQRA